MNPVTPAKAGVQGLRFWIPAPDRSPG